MNKVIPRRGNSLDRGIYLREIRVHEKPFGMGEAGEYGKLRARRRKL